MNHYTKNIVVDLNNDCIVTLEKYMRTKDTSCLKYLFKNFFLLSSLNQIEVVKVLKNKTLLKQTLNYWRTNKIAPMIQFVKNMLISFFDPIKPLSLYKDVIDMCYAPIDFPIYNGRMIFNNQENIRIGTFSHTFHPNGVDILLNDEVNYDNVTYFSYVQVFNKFIDMNIIKNHEETKCINKEACLYWINMYLTKIRENFNQNHVYVLPILEAAYKTRLISFDLLDTLWNITNDHDFKMSIADFNNMMNREELRAISQQLHNLSVRIKTWFEQRQAAQADIGNNNNYAGAHSIHKLDNFRSSYLKALHNKVPDIIDSAKVQQYIGKLVISDQRIMISINEINTFSYHFQVEHEHVEYNMQQIFERVCFLIMDLENGWKDELKQKYKIKNDQELEFCSELQETKLKYKSLHNEASDRLKQELIDMQGTCISGHINRIFNALVGYVDMLVLNYDEIIKESINEFVRECEQSENLLDAMVDQEYNTELQKILKDCFDHVQKAVKINDQKIFDCMIKYFGDAIKTLKFFETV